MHFFSEFGLVLSKNEMGSSDWSIGLDNRHCSIAAGHCYLTKYFLQTIECRTAYLLSMVSYISKQCTFNYAKNKVMCLLKIELLNIEDYYLQLKTMKSTINCF